LTHFQLTGAIVPLAKPRHILWAVLFGMSLPIAPAAYSAPGPAVTIVYAPVAAVDAIPSLTEWGVILLTLMILVIAYRHLRAKGRGNPVASILFVTASLIGIISNQDVIVRSAYASVLAFSSPSGGSTVVTSFPTDNGIIPTVGQSFSSGEIPNTSGVTQKITSITGSSGSCFGSIDTTNSTCTVNNTYASGATCHVAYINVC
jgi:hypothetical protein